MINDQERAAYIAGDTRTADLLARISELEDVARKVLFMLDTTEGVLWLRDDHQTIEDLREVLA